MHKHPREKKFYKIIGIISGIIVVTAVSIGFWSFQAKANQDLSKSDKEKRSESFSWNNTTIIATVITVVGTLLVGGSNVVQFTINNRREKWQILLNSLEWFGTDPHKRSSAISIVETKWEYHDDFRQRWASIFVTQAIYILTSDKSEIDKSEKEIEKVNFWRIINLLTNLDKESKKKKKKFAEDLSSYEINSLMIALNKPNNLDNSPDLLKNSKTQLSNLLSRLGSSK